MTEERRGRARLEKRYLESKEYIRLFRDGRVLH